MKKLSYVYRTFILLLVLSGCSVKEEQKPIKIQGQAQGTTFNITYYDSLQRDVSKEVDSILTHFDYSLSAWNDKSLLSRLNQSDSSFIILTDTFGYFFHSLLKSRELFLLTDGSFDPTVWPIIQQYGLGKDDVSDSTRDDFKDIIGFNKIDFRIGAEHKLGIEKPKKAQLDFNAIAQGYSVDIVSGFLEGKGIHSYMVEIGGELKVGRLKPTGEKWILGIDKPVNTDQRSL